MVLCCIIFVFDLMASSCRQFCVRPSKVSRIARVLLRPMVGLPVVMALGLGTLPARALPAASVQLFRLNGDGLKPMPAITDALDRAQLQNKSLAQAPQAGKAPVVLVAQSSPASLGSLSSYSQSFVGALPANLAGNLRLVYIDPNTGTIGQVLEEIAINGPNVSISPDRLQISIRLQPTSSIQPGQTVMMQLPSTTPAGDPIFYPNHLASTPCQFTVTALSALPLTPFTPVAPAGAPAGAPVGVVAAAPAAAAGLSPLAILGIVVLVGVGVAAAAGAFSSDGGGGGTNPSSQ